MICSKCKAKNPGSAEYCTNCGHDLRTSGTKFYTLKCANCSAIMDVDLEHRLASCSYCGTKQILKDSDAVEIERIKNQTHKEIELAKLKQVKPKSKVSQVILLTWTTILFLAALGILIDGDVMLSGVLMAQVAVFLCAWFVGKKEATKRRRKVYFTFIILGFLLFVLFGYVSDMEKLTKLNWPDTELTRMLPEPASNYGYVARSSPKVLDADMDKVSAEAHEKYLKECKAKGFTIVDEVTQSRYDAFNKDGYFLSVMYLNSGGTMYVTLTPPPKLKEIPWPPTELALNIPKPPSTLGSVDKLTSNAFVLTIGNMDEESFHNYVMSFVSMGYDGNYYEKGRYRMTTSDDKGNNVQLRYYVNNTMVIDYFLRD